ncbi:hypothetical protein ADK64_37170 [Streptomyces sp. MMG1121]|nr:hypothetical protein ADK64_37170 [Streptomyces sp. MMG1121]
MGIEGRPASGMASRAAMVTGGRSAGSCGSRQATGRLGPRALEPAWRRGGSFVAAGGVTPAEGSFLVVLLFTRDFGVHAAVG